IGTAVLVSGFISLTLTPMMCSRFVHLREKKDQGKVFRASEKVFDGMLHGYDWCLKKVLDHRLLTMIVSLVVLAGTILLFMFTPKGFFPSEDTGQIFMITEAGQDISFDGMREHQLALMD